MKVLGVSGSPIYESNTDMALKVAFALYAARELGRKIAMALLDKKVSH